MDKGSKILGWLGLIVGGVLSVGANVRSIHLPEMPPADAGSYVVAVAPVILAMIGIEQVSRWTHLPDALRFGVVGIASLIAAVASWTHIVSVLQHYGQPDMIAYSFPVAVDGIMLLSSVALFVSFPSAVQPDTDTDTARTDKPADTWTARTWTPAPSMDSLDTDKLEPLSETDKVVPSTDSRTDTAPDTIPDSLDTPAPVDIVDRVPAPRRPRGDVPPWKLEATALIGDNPTWSDAKIAQKLALWDTPEAGRKAISRVRKAMAESA